MPSPYAKDIIMSKVKSDYYTDYSIVKEIIKTYGIAMTVLHEYNFILHCNRTKLSNCFGLFLKDKI